jgi:LysM repeat protein
MTVTGAERRSPSPTDLAPSAGPATRPADPILPDVCPYLTTPAGTWRSSQPSPEHRCGAVVPVATLAPAKQRALCLGPAHSACATYLAAAAASGAPGGSHGGPGLWPSSRPAPMILDRMRPRSPLGGDRRRAGGQAMLVLLMVGAFVVVAVARTGTQSSAGASDSPAATLAGVLGPVQPSLPPASPTGVALASSSAAPSPAPSSAASPSAAGSPSASPIPTPAASRPPTRRYTVRAGDTLSGIAARFHISIKAIAAANGISDPRLIRIGDVLVIPAS